MAHSLYLPPRCLGVRVLKIICQLIYCFSNDFDQFYYAEVFEGALFYVIEVAGCFISNASDSFVDVD